jgi:hypothetical protein
MELAVLALVTEHGSRGRARTEYCAANQEYVPRSAGGQPTEVPMVTFVVRATFSDQGIKNGKQTE